MDIPLLNDIGAYR